MFIQPKPYFKIFFVSIVYFFLLSFFCVTLQQAKQNRAVAMQKKYS